MAAPATAAALTGMVPVAAAPPTAPPSIAAPAQPTETLPVVPTPLPDRAAVLEDGKGDPVVVVGRDRHHVMRALFGRHRRRGGFFHNLFHGRRGWRSRAGHNKACGKRYRSFSARTNTYKAYSGVRRVCLM